MMRTAWWPSSWNWRSLRSGTVWPRWTSMPVGSMPYLMRSGLPVATLRSSFLTQLGLGGDLLGPAADEGELFGCALHGGILRVSRRLAATRAECAVPLRRG